jgi:DNA invertase Pin-like site-specific DNA recombinase
MEKTKITLTGGKEKATSLKNRMDLTKIDRLYLHNSRVSIDKVLSENRTVITDLLTETDELVTNLLDEIRALQGQEDDYIKIIDGLKRQVLDAQSTVLTKQSDMRSAKMQDYMSRKKKDMVKFTQSIYGWKVNKKKKLVPDWEQQEVISSMREMLDNDTSASRVSKILNEIGISGARGGKWTSASVLRTVRGDFHKNLDKFTPPE